MRTWLLAAGLALSAIPALAAEDAYLPLDHWAYTILDRLRVRTGSLALQLEDRPIARGVASKAVERLRAEVEAGTLVLAETDLAHLRLLEAEFAPETGGDAGPAYHRLDWPAYDVHLELAWRADAALVRAPDLASVDPDSTGDVHVPDAQQSFLVWGRPEGVLVIGDRLTVQERLNYRLRFGDDVGRSNLDPSVGEAEFVHDNDDFVAVQRTLDTVLRLRLGFAHLEMGRMRFAWGPGREGRLLVSGEAPPMDVVRFIARLGHVQLTHAATQLRSGIGERWMAAHRIAYVSNRLTIGLSESVIFGNRSFDFAYLSPVQLFYIVESNNGDSDNNLFDADFRWEPARGLETYGEIVVDDSNIRDGWNFYGNKNAFQLGVVKTGLPELPDTDFHVEWSLVDQYTYTHRRPINVAEHYSSPIGHRIGTDSDLLTVLIRQWLHPRLDVRAAYEQERHGEGDISIGDDQRTDTHRNFLTGTVERTRSGIVGFSYRSVRGIEARFDARIGRVRNYGNERRSRLVELTQIELALKTQF